MKLSAVKSEQKDDVCYEEADLLLNLSRGGKGPSLMPQQTAQTQTNYPFMKPENSTGTQGYNPHYHYQSIPFLQDQQSQGLMHPSYHPGFLASRMGASSRSSLTVASTTKTSLRCTDNQLQTSTIRYSHILCFSNTPFPLILTAHSNHPLIGLEMVSSEAFLKTTKSIFTSTNPR